MNKTFTRRDFMKKAGRGCIAAGIAGSTAPLLVGCQPKEFDLILRGGVVYDGLGGTPYAADVGVKGERITALADLSNRSNHQTINLKGLAVAPGFIDVHTHTDISLLVNPKAESKIRQGVTTEIAGNCGDSPFPLSGESGEERKSGWQKEFDIEIDWSDTEGFLRSIENNGTALNYLTLVGHGTVRAAVMGLENRDPSPAELAEMRRLTRAAMEEGAYGVSTGLEYTPGSFAKTEEIIELCKVVAEYDGIYATHIRSEDVQLEEAIEEALRIADEARVKLQISHLKASQKRNWHKLPKVLTRIARASREGIRVHADRYPYTAFATTLQIMFPVWSREGDSEDFIARLKDDSLWQRMRPYVVDRVNALGSWESVLVTRVKSEERVDYQGKTIARLAEEAQKDPFEFARELLIEEDGRIDMCGFGMSDENTDKTLAFPLTMVGSDSSALAPYGILSRGNPHPRHYGAFPRYLGYYVREREILALPEALHRITAMAAQKFQLADRGVLAPGKFADIVVFNQDTIIDKATFTDTHHYPEGIDYVIVNGQIVINKGKHTEKLPGKVLRRT